MKKKQLTISSLDEMVDIVDIQNIVLHATTKKQAHEEGLLHRTVIAELKDSKGNWIFVKQADDRQDAGQLVSPVGGHVQSGETELEALYREVFEEIGIQEFEHKFVGRAVLNREVLGRRENHYFVLYEIFSDESLRLNHESVSHVSFTEKELKKRIKSSPKEFGNAFHFLLDTFYKDKLR